ncbi:MAG: ATP synthase F1 subunit epsilon [Lachnospiraceae bacterium]|nr:ATP synthase F1 subunit epsilon [Lachnospiraceae bacterium]
MAYSTFQLKILEAEGVFYEGACEFIDVPVVDGQYEILAHHINMISALVPGVMSYKTPDMKEAEVCAVSEGFVKVEDNEVVIIVDSAEHAYEIDEKRAKQAAERERSKLLQQKSIQEHRTAEIQLKKALNRMKVKRRSDNNKGI